MEAYELLEKKHDDWPRHRRGAIELALRDAYAAGCNARKRMIIVTAMDYAKRESERLANMLSDR